MRVKLKPVSEQTIVITGASSGIGLVTARLAAKRGAQLMLISRSEEALKALAQELRGQGAEVDYAVADVADEPQLRAAASKAIARFGGFDTWVNNAGVSIYGRNDEVARDDQRRLFETNFWGVVHGSLIALEHLKTRGGALINLGSEVSHLAVPLQGAYTASKHAVRGFTDSLRVELQNERVPVSVTLIKPSGIDTMFAQNAKNYMDVQPKLPAPVYAPDLVAGAILSAAEIPIRDVYVGGAARMMVGAARACPRLVDFLLSRFLVRAQRSRRPATNRRDHGLDKPGIGLMERSGMNGRVLESSLYTQAVLSRRSGALALGALGLILFAVVGVQRRSACRQVV